VQWHGLTQVLDDMRQIPAGLLLALLIVLCAVAGRLCLGLWQQNNMLQTVVDVADAKLSFYDQFPERLAKTQDFDRYKAVASKAILGQAALHRSSADLVAVIQANIRQLLLGLAATIFGLFSIGLGLYKKVSSNASPTTKAVI